eukprot:177557-Chlamydomonas_euryale.AAC.2
MHALVGTQHCVVNGCRKRIAHGTRRDHAWGTSTGKIRQRRYARVHMHAGWDGRMAMETPGLMYVAAEACCLCFSQWARCMGGRPCMRVPRFARHAIHACKTGCAGQCCQGAHGMCFTSSACCTMPWPLSVIALGTE